MAGLPFNPNSYPGNMTLPQPAIIVRAEEALIVIVVLILWVAAIALFFNRWGKIRMLEPYQPKFIQQHRPSCPLGDPIQHHRSFSKFNVNGDPFLTQQRIIRPRNNSVFVGSSMVNLPINPPRKVKSAVDLQNLILSDPALNKTPFDYRRSSFLPLFEKRRNLIFEEAREDRRDSCTKYERVQCHAEDVENKHKSATPIESRQNSIEKRDTPQCLTVSSRVSFQERRNSVLPVDDGRSGVHNFRRNSMFLINSLESDRYLIPQTHKSGVEDFRRNSMLIINNLNEDVGLPLLSNGSSSNIVSEVPQRRASVIPPYHEFRKCSVVPSKPISIKPKKKHPKVSKSLDETPKIKTHIGESPPISELRKQFLMPVITQNYVSTSSLGTSRVYGVKGGETRSNLELNGAYTPRIVETRCSSPGAEEDIKVKSAMRSESEHGLHYNENYSSQVNLIANEEQKEEDGNPGVNLTTSLTNINISSSIPLNVITSSESYVKTTNVFQSSQV